MACTCNESRVFIGPENIIKPIRKEKTKNKFWPVHQPEALSLWKHNNKTPSGPYFLVSNKRPSIFCEKPDFFIYRSPVFFSFQLRFFIKLSTTLGFIKYSCWVSHLHSSTFRRNFFKKIILIRSPEYLHARLKGWRAPKFERVDVSNIWRILDEPKIVGRSYDREEFINYNFKIFGAKNYLKVLSRRAQWGLEIYRSHFNNSIRHFNYHLLAPRRY